jgi:hypothetical protein
LPAPISPTELKGQTWLDERLAAYYVLKTRREVLAKLFRPFRSGSGRRK